MFSKSIHRRIRRLYLIGAGASCPYGLPTLKKLTRDLYNFIEGGNRKIFLEAIYESFGIDLEQSEGSPDFEELLNRLDPIALRYVSSETSNDFEIIRKKAAEIALNGLRDFFLYHCDIMKKIEGPYDHLICSLASDEAIVSFNWDILIELAFKRNSRDFSYWDENEKSTVLLKPHGSINWFALLDRELLSVDLNKNWQIFGNNLSYYMLFLKDPLGSRDLGKSSPFLKASLATIPAIVPPMASKVLSVGGRPRDGFVQSGHERTMRKIWNLFRKFIIEATELIVIGYSLPGTDAASIAILKQFGRSENKKIIIIDKDQQILKRYQRLVHPNATIISDDFKKFKPEKI